MDETLKAGIAVTTCGICILIVMLLAMLAAPVNIG